MSLLGRVARAIVAKDEPPPPPLHPAQIEEFKVGKDSSPFTSEKARSKRNEAAMSLVDEDTYGYLLIVLKRDPNGSGRMEVETEMKRAWWPAFRTVLQRCLAAMRD